MPAKDQPMTTTTITPDDLRRIEDKLDKLIRFFNIDAAPARARREIEAMADRVVIDIEKKQRRKK